MHSIEDKEEIKEEIVRNVTEDQEHSAFEPMDPNILSQTDNNLQTVGAIDLSATAVGSNLGPMMMKPPVTDLVKSAKAQAIANAQKQFSARDSEDLTAQNTTI